MAKVKHRNYPPNNKKQMTHDKNQWTHQLPFSMISYESAKQVNFRYQTNESGKNQWRTPRNKSMKKSLTDWWLNQPIWKICSSNWIIFPRVSGLFNETCWKNHQSCDRSHPCWNVPWSHLSFPNITRVDTQMPIPSGILGMWRSCPPRAERKQLEILEVSGCLRWVWRSFYYISRYISMIFIFKTVSILHPCEWVAVFECYLSWFGTTIFWAKLKICIWKQRCKRNASRFRCFEVFMDWVLTGSNACNAPTKYQVFSLSLILLVLHSCF